MKSVEIILFIGILVIWAKMGSILGEIRKIRESLEEKKKEKDKMILQKEVGMVDSLTGFVRGMANRDKEAMVFDWDKAARLIREQQPKYVSAGLRDDWEHTGGEIYADGEPISRDDTYTYLSSTWAIPEIDIDGDRQPCYRMQSEVPDWDSDTFWPESAIAILEGNKDEDKNR